LLEPQAPKKRGRPIQWTDEQREDLLELVAIEKEVAAEDGERLSDSEALRRVLTQIAEDRGVGQYRADAAFARWRKQLQLAKKKFKEFH
jgi:hypothetical protein